VLQISVDCVIGRAQQEASDLDLVDAHWTRCASSLERVGASVSNPMLTLNIVPLSWCSAMWQ
jgi:hypothetical protein